MEKLCFILLFIFVNFLILLYMWYVHNDLRTPMKVKNIKFIENIKHDESQKVIVKDSSSDDTFIKNLLESRKEAFGNEVMKGYKQFKEIRILCWIMTSPINHKTKAQKVCKCTKQNQILERI